MSWIPEGFRSAILRCSCCRDRAPRKRGDCGRDGRTGSGWADYLLRVYCADLSALNILIQQILLPHRAVARVQSQIVMDQFKVDAALPT